MPRQPNFLLVSTDQQRADHLGCYGNPIVRTPAIDRLASRGLTFDNFFVACPICMPNRVAILTGRMPTTNGTRHNGIPLELDALTFVDQLREAGYHTGLVGKAHFQNITGHPLKQRDIFPGDPPVPRQGDAHRLERNGPEYQAELMPLWREDPNRPGPVTPYYGYEFVRFANGHSDHVQGHYTGWLAERHGDPDSLRGVLNALASPGCDAPQAWRTAMPEALYPTTYIAETCKDFIAAHVAAPADEPFFLHCSFTDPHHPFTPPGRYFDMYEPADMPLPASFGHVDPNEPDLLRKLRADLAEGRANNTGPYPFCATADQVRQIIALTYGMISMVDDAIAGLLDQLDELGIRDNTVVIFTSDHGDFMGDHGLMLKHGFHYDGVLRVPFIWVDPDAEGPQRTDIHGSSVDISACVLSRASVAPVNGNQGIDVVSAARSGAAIPRQGVLIEEDELGVHLGREQGLRTRSYVQDNWRLTLWQGMDGGELFDRNADPHEMHNLWSDPNASSIKARMTEAMLRETIRLTDSSPYATHVA